MKHILILTIMLSGCASFDCETVINKEVEANNKLTGMNASWYVTRTNGHDAEVHKGFNRIGVNLQICKLPYSHQQFIIKHEFGHLLSFRKNVSKLTSAGLEDEANLIAGAMARDQGVDITEYVAYSDKLCSYGESYWCDRSYYARYGFNNYLIDYSQ